eukprot:SM000108S14212  [mRNA]  locus=s108:262319:265996:+ [translate_table: standard]
MALGVSHRGLKTAAALATAVPLLLLLVESLQVAGGAGCSAAGGVGASGLHELSEFLLHRTKGYGPMILDENRGILLYAVENELWRLPVNLQSTQVFDSCNYSSRTYASYNAKTPFVLNKALGLAYVAFSRSGNPGLAIIDYSGSLNQISEVLFNISSLNLDPGSPSCILFDSSTGQSLLGFETVGIAAVDASDPYHPFLIHWYPAAEGIFTCQQLHRQGLFFAKKDSTLTVVFIDLDAKNSTLTSSSTFNLTSDGAMTVVVDPSEGMAYFGADNPPTYGKINVTSPLSTRQQEAYFLPAAGSFQAVLFDNYKRQALTNLGTMLRLLHAWQYTLMYRPDASDGQGVNVAAITTSACSTGYELCLTSQEVTTRKSQYLSHLSHHRQAKVLQLRLPEQQMVRMTSPAVTSASQNVFTSKAVAFDLLMQKNM